MDQNLFNEYEKSGLCPFDWLEETPVPDGWTFGAAFEFYIQLMHEVDGDRFLRITDEETIDLYTGESETNSETD